MKIVSQRYNYDCGIACLANLMGTTYEEAEYAIFGDDGCPDGRGTSTKDVRRGALNLGAVVRLERLRPTKRWEDIPDNSLVKISWGNKGWHWVCWIGGKVYDPLQVSTYDVRTWAELCHVKPVLHSYLQICRHP